MAGTRLDGRSWLLIIGLWAVVAGLLAWRAMAGGAAAVLLNDTDDAMRMTTATDLLTGQGWQDLVQHRDNAPYGSPMHWSRLVDAPIAVLMALGGPWAAAVAWPLLLMLPLMVLSAKLTRALVPDAGVLTASVLPVLSLIVVQEFSPGRVDHHNVQILLVLATALVLVTGRERVWGGVAAGLLVATSLAIGMETLPLAVAGIGAYGLVWAVEPGRYGRALLGFAAALAAGTAGHFGLATAPAQYWAPACDALSVFYVAAAVLGGAGLAASVVIGGRLGAIWQRLAVLVVAGAVALAALLALYPQCLGGPYAQVDPRVMAGLFADIREAKPVWVLASDTPAAAVALFGPVLLALAITAWRAAAEGGRRRGDWLMVLALFGVATLVAVLQTRGARLAAPLMVPGAAYVIAAARRFYLRRAGVASVLGLVGSWLLFTGPVQLPVIALARMMTEPRAVVAEAPAVQSLVSCWSEPAFARLGALPAALVAAPITLSSHVLAYTAHAVLAAGFHRNTAGIVDELAFFSGDQAAARDVAARRGLELVVVCPGRQDQHARVSAAEMAAWPFLVALSAPDEALQIYRIDLSR